MSKLMQSISRDKAIVDHFRREVDYDQMPEEAWQLIDNGLTLGLFQIEEGNAVRRLAKQIKPRSIEDLALLVALNKPGPMRSGETDRYVRRRNAEEAVSYPHPILEDILDITLGIFVYQEQVIAYFTKIGYSLSEADHIRKVMGKKLVDEMKKEIPKYMEHAEQHMSKAQAQNIWELITNFSKYGFNKAHAIGYAMILAWCIYTKWKWPTEFIMASIETNAKKIGGYVAEAKRMEISVRPPDVNLSDIKISKVGEEILYGLVDIKGIGEAGALKVQEGRPYVSLEDYIDRCTADAGVRKKLTAAGAFDSFGERIDNCPTCEGKGKVRRETLNAKGDKMILKSFPCDDCYQGLIPVDLPSLRDRIALEEEYLGIGLTDMHEETIVQYADRIAKLEPLSAADTDEVGEVKVPGIIVEVRKTRTRADLSPAIANKEMCHITLRWAGDELRTVAFPKVYETYKFVFKTHTVGEFTIKTGPKGPQIITAYQYIPE